MPNKTKQHRGRTCRIEELENREMLSAAPVDFDTMETSVPTMLPDAFVWDRYAPALHDSSDAAPAQAPYGAESYNTSEYMIGNVYVTLILMESNGKKDANVTDWTSAQIDAVKTQVQISLTWWETTFDKSNPDSLISLNFVLDCTWADTPFETSYEPITRAHQAESLWAGEFLVSQGYTGDYSRYQSHLQNLSAFNNVQRETYGTDWAITIFVVNSRTLSGAKYKSGTLDDGLFAYTWLGGPNMVMTYDNGNWGINNMAIVSAHEIGHLFWALDEYIEAGSAHSYTAYSGYYNVQNTNAAYGRPSNVQPQVSSIMAGANLQLPAFYNYTSSLSSLEMIGWRDSDGDGILDVLDTPLTLTSLTGNFDLLTHTFKFTGTSSVTTLPNQNTQPPWRWSSHNNITLNTVDKLQYQINGGDWVTLDTPYGRTMNVGIDATVMLTDIGMGSHTIIFRTICERTGVVSAEQPFSFDIINNEMSPPDVPVNVWSTAQTVSSVTLAWDRVRNAAVYDIRYRKTGDTNETTRLGISDASTTVSDLVVGTYEFQVRAVNGKGESEWSEPVFVTLLDFEVDNKSSNSVTISWVTESRPGDVVIQYKMLDSSTWITWRGKVTITGDVTWTTIPGLQAGTYDFRWTDAHGNPVGDEIAGIKISDSTTIAANPLKPKVGVVKRGDDKPTISTITLTWKDPSRATDKTNVRYVITCSVKEGRNWKVLEYLTITTTTYRHTFTGLNHSTYYKFTVTVVNDKGRQTDARGKNVAAAVTAKTAIYTAVQKLKKTAAPTAVTLTWMVSRANLPDDVKTHYEIFWLDGRTEKPLSELLGTVIANLVHNDIKVNDITATARVIDLLSNKPYKFGIKEIATVYDVKIGESLPAKVSVRTK